MHAFVTSCIDCCSSLLVGLPLVGYLGPVLRSETEFCVQMPALLEDCPSFLLSLPKCTMHYCFGCLSSSGHNIVLLRWSSCVLRCAPSYLHDLCCPVSVLAARRVLRSAARGELLVPQAHLATVQQRAFSVVGPSAWNDIPVELRSLLMARPSQFHISLKSFFFGHDWAGSASIRLVSRRGVI